MFKVQDSTVRVPCSEFCVLCLATGVRVAGSEFLVQSSWFKVPGLVFRVLGVDSVVLD